MSGSELTPTESVRQELHTMRLEAEAQLVRVRAGVPPTEDDDVIRHLAESVVQLADAVEYALDVQASNPRLSIGVSFLKLQLIWGMRCKR